jgi:hypothetical protein
MIVELHNKLGQPQSIEATRLVVRDPVVGVVAVVIEAGPNQYYAIHRGDGDDAVNRALASMGIKETVFSNHVDIADYPKPPGDLIMSPGDIKRA